MSVLIKGEKMPNNCHECKFKRWTHSALKGSWFCPLRHKFLSVRVITQGKRYSDCPLVDAPPHGRLIDADVFEEMLNSEEGVELKDAPTVIESEEQGNE